VLMASTNELNEAHVWFSTPLRTALPHVPARRLRCRGLISPSNGKGHILGKKKFLGSIADKIALSQHTLLPRISILDGSEDQVTGG
jgi:hypothetical protein